MDKVYTSKISFLRLHIYKYLSIVKLKEKVKH